MLEASRSAGEGAIDSQNVLIVENDAAVSALVADVLTEAGYRPAIVAQHSLIAETVERWHPRCVLLDGELTAGGENRSWRDAAAIRRAHPVLPVILFTGDPAVVAEARAGRSYRSRAAGFAGIIVKPFAIEDLLAAVKAALGAPAGTDVVAMTVHELRQPLAVIRGQVQLVRRRIGEDPEGQRLALDRTLGQLDRLDGLIDQLLDRSRLAADDFRLDATPLDLADALTQTIATYEYDAAARIRFERPSGTVVVYGDAARIVQIADNLLSNALKYSPAEAPIEVSLATDGIEAQVRVTDHGVGIPEAERALLFTPFYRSSRALGIRGTGLGLHIARRLAEHHGGRLWLEASSSAGSVFVFALPLAGSDSVPAEARLTRSPERRAASPAP